MKEPATEELILVDPDDRVLGYLDKASCHDGEGVRHRAFSVFVFDPAGGVLLQERSARKRLWPLFWANSCCSHPRRGETTEEAAHRRTSEELGLRPRLTFLYRFEYQATFGDRGAEHELCSVYAGAVTARERAAIEVDPDEVQAVEWVAAESLEMRLAREPDRYSPWFLLEWPRVWREHRDVVDRLVEAASRAPRSDTRPDR